MEYKYIKMAFPTPESFLEHLLKGCKGELGDNGCITWYDSHGQWLFRQDFNLCVLYCYYPRTWQILQEVYSIKDVCKSIKEILDSKMHSEPLEPKPCYLSNFVEDSFSLLKERNQYLLGIIMELDNAAMSLADDIHTASPETIEERRMLLHNAHMHAMDALSKPETV